MTFLRVLTVIGFLSATASQAVALSVGDILITDFDSSVGRIVRYNSQLMGLSTVASGGNLSEPFAVAIGPSGEVYAVDAGTLPKVLRVNPDTGTTSVLTSSGLLLKPHSLTLTSDGSLYVADMSSGGTGAIIRVNPITGAQSLVSSGGQPLSISADLQDRLVVARNARVDLLTTTGSTLWSSAVSNFFPAAVCVDASNTIFSWGVDLANNAPTQVFKYEDGTGTATHVADLMATSSPGGMCAGPGTDLFLCDPSAGTMFKLDSSTATASGLVFPGSLSSPYGIAVVGVRLGIVDAAPQTWGRLKAAYRN